jgi:hypothetical protein
MANAKSKMGQSSTTVDADIKISLAFEETWPPVTLPGSTTVPPGMLAGI